MPFDAKFARLGHAQVHCFEDGAIVLFVLGCMEQIQQIEIQAHRQSL